MCTAGLAVSLRNGIPRKLFEATRIISDPAWLPCARRAWPNSLAETFPACERAGGSLDRAIFLGKGALQAGPIVW